MNASVTTWVICGLIPLAFFVAWVITMPHIMREVLSFHNWRHHRIRRELFVSCVLYFYAFIIPAFCFWMATQ